NKSFDTYTLKLKARKLSGLNAFIIPFAVKDDSTQLRAHIGSWLNSHCVFESVSNNFDVAGITNQVKLDQPIESGRWYDITIEVGMDKIDCYLDGKLLMTYKAPQQFFALAGKDEKNGDIILKFVNASSENYETTIHVDNNQRIMPEGKLLSISSASGSVENSFENPLQYIPVEQKITGV